MNEVVDLVKLSKYAGQRFDLAQAAGGNSSVKLDDGTMLIKASGFSLSEVELIKGYAKLDNNALQKILDDIDIREAVDKRERDQRAAKCVQDAVIESGVRPSIETLLHSGLGKFVLHTHPVVVNAIACRADWRKVFNKLFKHGVCVDYRTPGYDLAYELLAQVKDFEQRERERARVIFLQNHGLIVSAATAEEVVFLTEEVVSKLEGYLCIELGKYKLANKVAALVNATGSQEHKIAYLCQDAVLSSLLIKKRPLFSAQPFCPDTLVYCGYNVVELDTLDHNKLIAEYVQKNGETPKIIIYKDALFFIAQNVRKARDIEDVFRFHIMTLQVAKGQAQYLPTDELLYLSNWEAEKYRQNL